MSVNVPEQFLIDGVDRLGKSTLIKKLQETLGYHLVVHYDKPKLLPYYISRSPGSSEALKMYQTDCNINMFKMISSNIKVIFDRTHLGEAVYAKRYRDYCGNYVFRLEEEAHTLSARLILLTTSDFSFQEDDGESHDWSQRIKEQQDFIKAFCTSSIKDKVIIDINDGKGGFKSPNEILAEALKCNVQDLFDM